MSTRRGSGEITSDIEESLLKKMCTHFYKSLYTQLVHTPENKMKSIQDTKEDIRVLRRRTVKDINFVKRHKTHGMDGITSNNINLRRGSVLTHLTNIVNNILKTK